MNSGNLKIIMSIIIGVLILGIFLKILPYLILGGIGIYLITKIYTYVRLKLNKTKKKTDKIEDGYESYTDKAGDSEEFDTKNAIDVDFKDVK